MESIFRKYEEGDYEQCEFLVNRAWEFDNNLKPQGLANLAKYANTKGAETASNYRMVVEVNGDIIGFIFAFNELSNKPRRNILFGLSFRWRLWHLKIAERDNKKKLIDAINTHEKNRSQIISRGKSEIVLLVIRKSYQGLGYGKKLWFDFMSNCKATGAKSIFVEANALSSGHFYEKLGFQKVGDFDSPIHEFMDNNGHACIYEYLCK